MGRGRKKAYRPLYSAVGIDEVSQRTGVRLHSIVLLHRMKVIDAIHDDKGRLYVSEALVKRIPALVEKHITTE